MSSCDHKVGNRVSGPGEKVKKWKACIKCNAILKDDGAEDKKSPKKRSSKAKKKTKKKATKKRKK